MNEMEFKVENTEETCDIKAFERNKYFYGKLLTVRDFETEQRYFNSKRYMLNRLIHGIGLVCGLEVSEPSITNQQLSLKLTSGVALDCCGREIVIEDAGVYNVDGSPAEGTNYIYLKYLECLKEPVPTASNPSACEEACCYSRIKESFKLELSQQAPPSAEDYNCKKTWQDRAQDIQNLANELKSSEPLASLEAKLIVFADAYLKTAGCTSCNDPKALLAVIKVTGSSVEIDTDETLALRGVVYSNPMLYEILKCHLTDVDNPHQVTAQQTGALVSVDGVDNPGGDVDLIAKNAITIAPDNNNNQITIGENHSGLKNNPHQVSAKQAGALVSVDGVDNPGGDVDLIAKNAITIAPDNNNNQITIGENHSGLKNNPHQVSAKQTGALVSVDGISNPGGNIDLVAGEGVTIEPDPAAFTIKLSATVGISGANTGIIQLTIPKATGGEIAVAASVQQPGHVVRRDIIHELKTELSPAIILGLVMDNGIIMEDDFITQRGIIEIIANEYKVQAPPAVSFRALAVTPQKFDILAINLNPEADETIRIRWWAVPATKTIGGRNISIVTEEIRTKLGESYISTLAKEKNIAESEVNWVIGEMVEAVSTQPSGITMDGISQATGTKTETAQPVIEAMVASGILEATGTGARRKFTIKA